MAGRTCLFGLPLAAAGRFGAVGAVDHFIRFLGHDEFADDRVKVVRNTVRCQKDDIALFDHRHGARQVVQLRILTVDGT